VWHAFPKGKHDAWWSQEPSAPYIPRGDFGNHGFGNTFPEKNLFENACAFHSQLLSCPADMNRLSNFRTEVIFRLSIDGREGMGCFLAKIAFQDGKTLI